MLRERVYVNEEALANSTYNPDLDKRSLMLLEIMEKTAAADPVGENQRLKEYEDLFDLAYISAPLTTSPLPTPDVPLVSVRLDQPGSPGNPGSPFRGILVNPAQCIVDDGRAAVADLRSFMNTTFGSNPEWQAFVPEFDQTTAPILEGLNRVENHTNRVTNNLPSLLGIAQAALAIATVANLLSNPCLGLNGFIGSIMDEGKELLNDVAQQIKAGIQIARDFLEDVAGDVSAALGPLIADIRDTIAQATAVIAEVTEKIAKEIASFAKAMLQQVRQGLAELMASLPQDPCLRGLLTSVATGTAAAVIG